MLPAEEAIMAYHIAKKFSACISAENWMRGKGLIVFLVA